MFRLLCCLRTFHTGLEVGLFASVRTRVCVSHGVIDHPPLKNELFRVTSSPSAPCLSFQYVRSLISRHLIRRHAILPCIDECGSQDEHISDTGGHLSSVTNRLRYTILAETTHDVVAKSLPFCDLEGAEIEYVESRLCFSKLLRKSNDGASILCIDQTEYGVASSGESSNEKAKAA